MIQSEVRTRSRFATTSWTVVFDARPDGERSRVALGELCATYWYPLYAFLRRQGARAQDAEDTVQAFFCWLTESGVIARADRGRGRFRTFLVTSLKQFAARRHEHESAAKRNPGRPVLSINSTDGQQRYAAELSHVVTPDRQFEYAWAMTVVERAMSRLRSEWADAGRADRFEVLKPALTGTTEASGREVAAQLGMTEGAVRVAVHRLKRRYGELLREEVGATVSADAEIDDELRHLIEALRSY